MEYLTWNDLLQIALLVFAIISQYSGSVNNF